MGIKPITILMTLLVIVALDPTIAYSNDDSKCCCNVDSCEWRYWKGYWSYLEIDYKGTRQCFHPERYGLGCNIKDMCEYLKPETYYEYVKGYGNCGWVDGDGDDNNCLSTYILGEDDPRLDTLRQFRDEVLSQSPIGQEIIKLYYEWSPVIVEMIEEDEEFKEEVKEMVELIK